MTKLKILVTLTVAALVLLMPAIAWAQPAVMGVYGNATMDGVTAPNGTAVTAYIEGEVAATASTSGGTGFYTMNIAQPTGAVYQGKTVTFRVGGLSAPETTVWDAGLNKSLNLSGSSIPAAPASISLSPSEGVGALMVTGANFSAGSKVTIKWGTASAATVPSTVTANPDKTFSAMLAPPAGATPGTYTITATDAAGGSATATFTRTDAVGPAGAAGAQGPAGPAGAPGPAGPAGEQGPAGAKGDTGAIGPRGPEGPRGPTGTAGAPGAQGSAGTAGAPGAQGSAGATGPAGAPGAQGSAGATGQDAPVAWVWISLIVGVIAIVVAIIALVLARKPKAAA